MAFQKVLPTSCSRVYDCPCTRLERFVFTAFSISARVMVLVGLLVVGIECLRYHWWIGRREVRHVVEHEKCTGITADPNREGGWQLLQTFIFYAYLNLYVFH